MITHRRIPTAIRHPFLTLMVFCSAYFLTISVNAQETLATGDTIHVQTNQEGTFTGTIQAVDDDSIDINSGGKIMRVSLDKIKMEGEASTIFTPGLYVTVKGDLEGDDFGVPIVQATSVIASVAPTTAIVTDGDDETPRRRSLAQ